MRKYLLIILLFYSTVALSQPKLFSRVWGSATGSTYFITSLAQDQMGYIWFGTAQSGLQRFDGTQVTSMIGDGKIRNVMSNSWVESLFVDPDNII